MIIPKSITEKPDIRCINIEHQKPSRDPSVTRVEIVANLIVMNATHCSITELYAVLCNEANRSEAREVIPIDFYEYIPVRDKACLLIVVDMIAANNDVYSGWMSSIERWVPDLNRITLLTTRHTLVDIQNIRVRHSSACTFKHYPTQAVNTSIADIGKISCIHCHIGYIRNTATILDDSAEVVTQIGINSLDCVSLSIQCISIWDKYGRVSNAITLQC